MQRVSAQEAWRVFQNAECLHDQASVEAAVSAMANGVAGAVGGDDPLMVCVMNGGVVPFSRLLLRLSFPLQTDYVHATRYRGALSGGDLHWIAGPAVSPEDRVVVLVDDILDEGATLAAIEARYREWGAKAIYKAVLVQKDRARSVPITADFVGVDVPDRYVFGYGMDYKGYLRNAPGIFAVADE